MERLICLIIGYCCGMFQTAFIYGKINHIDIRQYGSGNAGTTNALRTLGKKAGIIVFIGDVLKVVIATTIVRLIFSATHPDNITMLVLYAGLGTVLGHNYPIYLGFKGGKGIAATAGVILSLLCWQMCLAAFIFFMIATLITRYVSVGSLVMVLGSFGCFVLFDYLGYIKGLNTFSATLEATIIMFLFVIFAYVRHRTNIERLINGTENALFGKKEK